MADLQVFKKDFAPVWQDELFYNCGVCRINFWKVS